MPDALGKQIAWYQAPRAVGLRVDVTHAMRPDVAAAPTLVPSDKLAYWKRHVLVVSGTPGPSTPSVHGIDKLPT
jgi:hypothetical protein